MSCPFPPITNCFYYFLLFKVIIISHIFSVKLWSKILFNGLYYNIIMTIISDDRKWALYYEIIIMIANVLPLALASVINYDPN